MANYLKQVWRTIRTDFGGTVTAGAPVMSDAAQGAGVLAAAVTDEEVTGIALDDQSDGDRGTVVLSGIILMKGIGQLDALEPVQLHTAVDSVDTSTAADLTFGRSQFATAGAVSTRSVPVCFDFTSGGAVGLAEA